MIESDPPQMSGVDMLYQLIGRKCDNAELKEHGHDSVCDVEALECVVFEPGIFAGISWAVEERKFKPPKKGKHLHSPFWHFAWEPQSVVQHRVRAQREMTTKGRSMILRSGNGSSQVINQLKSRIQVEERVERSDASDDYCWKSWREGTQRWERI